MKGYQTYIIAALQAAFGALAVFDWAPVLNDPKAGMALVGSAILFAVMRAVTSTPPGAAK